MNPVDGSLTIDLPIQTPPGRELSFPLSIRWSSSQGPHLQANPSNLTFSWTTFGSEIVPSPGKLTLPGYAATAIIKYTRPAAQGDGSGWPPGTTLYCLGSRNYIFQGLEGVQRDLALGSLWNDNTYPAGCGPSSIGSSNLHGYIASGGSPTPNGTQPPLTVVDQSGTTYQFVAGPTINSYTQASLYGGPWSMLA